MADASKLKRLGSPPPMDEARADLIPAPSVAEPGSEVKPSPKVEAGAPAPQSIWRPEAQPDTEDYERVDGRTLRKTGRTIPFSTRLNADTDRLIRRIAGKHGILIAEVVERGAILLQKELESK